jgi:hypothetical protein
MSAVTWVVCCGPCDLAGEPLFHQDEADQLAGVHDALHHRGRPTAEVRPCPSPDPYAAIPRRTEVPR